MAEPQSPRFRKSEAGENAVLERNPLFAHHYANRVEVQLGQMDLKLKFMHLIGHEADGLLHIEEKCTVTLSFGHARILRDLLNNFVQDSDPAFQALPIPMPLQTAMRELKPKPNGSEKP